MPLNKLTSIQALRAIAAWSVVVGHVFLSTIGAFPEAPRELIGVATRLAHGGVDLFFVISGAIMFLVTRNMGGGRQAVAFLLRRAARVYPLFWMAMTVAIIIAGTDPNVLDALSYYALAVYPEPLMVGWSLTFELRFYLLVALGLWLVPASHGVRFGVIAAVIVALVIAGQFGALPGEMLTNPMMLEFVFGAGVAALVSRTQAWAVPVAIIGLVGLALGMTVMDATGVLVASRVAFLGIPAALILYAGMAMERAGKLTAPAWLVRAGDESYSVYLWHIPIITLLVRFRIEEGAGIYLHILAALLATYMISRFSWRVIEAPFSAGRVARV